MNKQKKINLVDTTMRDGSHAMSHSFTVENVRPIARGLDKAGVGMIELSHGDGLGGSSLNYGLSKENEFDLIKAAAEEIKHAKLAVLLLPGVGTIADLEKAKNAGANAVRVATHVTEADVSLQYIKWAKQHNLFVVGFLMMAHMASPEKILEQAQIFEEAGVDYINLADSAGYCLPKDVKARISLLTEKLHTPIGFHAHNNLGLAVANSLAALEEGASYIDATCCGLGAGAGNTQLEVLSAVLARTGYETGADPFLLMDVAEKYVRPIMKRPQEISTDSLMLGYAGVYSSFLLHTQKAAEKFGLEPRKILIELGKRKMVGGQEDMILDIAYELTQEESEDEK